MTDYLFARPSVLEGIGRNIDIFGMMNDYNYSESGEEADLMALKSDMYAIYGDLDKAYRELQCRIGK
jgi:hypothetical protein